MFNLDRLNDVRPEVRRGFTWEKGLIPESPDPSIETLVQRVNRGRFRFELGDSSIRPGPLATQAQTNTDERRTEENGQQQETEGPGVSP